MQSLWGRLPRNRKVLSTPSGQGVQHLSGVLQRTGSGSPGKGTCCQKGAGGENIHHSPGTGHAGAQNAFGLAGRPGDRGSQEATRPVGIHEAQALLSTGTHLLLNTKNSSRAVGARDE
ncbi:hypothetical protein ACOJUR_08090 [Alicyclobacillus tolerans]|uniref:hypothetical protein n=1 Tax=Alicyclobacillus tolerans TaxID=90970 RepID=UPI003B81864C